MEPAHHVHGWLRFGAGPGARHLVFDDQVLVGADGAWALTTSALCRINISSLTRAGENIRKGIGKFQGRMVGLSGDLLGISSFYGLTFMVVSRHDGTVVNRLRMGAPALVYALPDGRHRCWSAHNAVATGERQDMAGVPNVWDVLPRHLSVFDAWTLAELHRTAAPADGIEVLGADARGRIVITSRRAVTLLDPASFDVEDAYQHHADLGGAVLLAEHNCVVLQTSIVMGDGLTVVRWQ